MGAATRTLQAARAAVRVWNVCSSAHYVIYGLSRRHCWGVLRKVGISGAYVIIGRVRYHSDVWIGSRGGLTAANDGSSVPPLKHSSASQVVKTGAVLFQ